MRKVTLSSAVVIGYRGARAVPGGEGSLCRSIRVRPGVRLMWWCLDVTLRPVLPLTSPTYVRQVDQDLSNGWKQRRVFGVVKAARSVRWDGL